MKAPPTGRAFVVCLGGITIGLGHAYVGLARRGAAWAITSLVAALVWVVALPTATSTRGLLGAVFGLLGTVLLLWLASLVDLWRITKRPLGTTKPRAAGVFLVVSLLVTTLLPEAARALVVDSFRAPDGSMAPLVFAGDHVLAERLVLFRRAPRRGDVVVVRSPDDPDRPALARVVALPGDRLELRDGLLALNGTLVPRCPLGKVTLATPDDELARGQVYVEWLDGRPHLAVEALSPPAAAPPAAAADGYLLLADDRRTPSKRSPLGARAASKSSLLGRAFVIWLPALDDLEVDPERLGAFVDPLRLPDAWGGLEPLLERCLAAPPIP